MKNLSKLYKRSTTGAVQEWAIIAKDNYFYTLSGQSGGIITKSAPTYCSGKNLGKSNRTTDSEQALLEAQAKWQKKVDSGYVESLDEVDGEAKFFKPMLAKGYDDEKHKLVGKSLIIQPKLDGIRAIITKNGATTRNGKEHKAIPHILKALEPLFKKDPNLILDGELYNHDLHDDFNKIASLVRKTKPTSEDLAESARLAEFHCYDCPRIGSLTQKDKFIDRFSAASKLLKGLNNPSIKVVTNLVANTDKGIKSCHDELVEKGYEGVIVRVADAPYVNKRSDTLLKLKQFDTDEFTIEGILAGKGNKAEMAGSIELHSKSGEYFTSNIKATHAVLIDMLKNKKKYVGKVCTVKYFGLTPDKEIPRFPYVVDTDRWSYE